MCPSDTIRYDPSESDDDDDHDDDDNDDEHDSSHWLAHEALELMLVLLFRQTLSGRRAR